MRQNGPFVGSPNEYFYARTVYTFETPSPGYLEGDADLVP